MKKTSIFMLATALVMGLAFTGCGGDVVVKPTDTKISGPLGDYFKIVDREYKITNEGTKLIVEIERTQEGLPDEWEEDTEYGTYDGKLEVGLYLELRDGDGNVLEKETTSRYNMENDFKPLVKLAVGEKHSFEFSVSSRSAVDAEAFNMGSSIEYHEAEIEEDTDVDEDDDEVYSSSTSADEDIAEIKGKAKDMYDEAKGKAKDMYDEAMKDDDLKKAKKTLESTAKAVKALSDDDALGAAANALDALSNW